MAQKHKILYLNPNFPWDVEAELDKEAKDGWEVVSTEIIRADNASASVDPIDQSRLMKVQTKGYTLMVVLRK